MFRTWSWSSRKENALNGNIIQINISHEVIVIGPYLQGKVHFQYGPDQETSPVGYVCNDFSPLFTLSLYWLNRKNAGTSYS